MSRKRVVYADLECKVLNRSGVYKWDTSLSALAKAACQRMAFVFHVEGVFADSTAEDVPRLIYWVHSLGIDMHFVGEGETQNIVERVLQVALGEEKMAELMPKVKVGTEADVLAQLAPKEVLILGAHGDPLTRPQNYLFVPELDKYVDGKYRVLDGQDEEECIFSHGPEEEIAQITAAIIFQALEELSEDESFFNCLHRLQGSGFFNLVYEVSRLEKLYQEVGGSILLNVNLPSVYLASDTEDSAAEGEESGAGLASATEGADGKESLASGHQSDSERDVPKSTTPNVKQATEVTEALTVSLLYISPKPFCDRRIEKNSSKRGGHSKRYFPECTPLRKMYSANNHRWDADIAEARMLLAGEF